MTDTFAFVGILLVVVLSVTVLVLAGYQLYLLYGIANLLAYQGFQAPTLPGAIAAAIYNFVYLSLLAFIIRVINYSK